MNSNRLVLNTLVKQSEHNSGIAQDKLVTELLDSGVSNIELRREYGNSTISEFDRLSKFRMTKRINYFYSIPDDLFINKHLNLNILQYVSEAQRLGASYIKMNLGDFDESNDTFIDYLLTIIPSGIQLNVENDQTESNSDIEKLSLFFEKFEGRNQKVGFVNDLGNWIFTDQDAITATNRLLKYTRFVHLKGYVLDQDNKPKTVSFVDGKLNWRLLLEKFSKDLPIALEYPADDVSLQADIQTLISEDL